MSRDNDAQGPPDPCPICKKQYPMLGLLEQHIERRHAEGDAGPGRGGARGKELRDGVGGSRSRRLQRPDRMLESVSPLLYHAESERLAAAREEQSRLRARQSSAAAHHQQSQAHSDEERPGLRVRSKLRALAEYASGASSTPTKPARPRAASLKEPAFRIPRDDSNARHALQSSTPHPTNNDDDKRNPQPTTTAGAPSLPDKHATISIPAHTTPIPDQVLVDPSAYRQCPLEECGELVLADELDLHIELHQSEQLAVDESNNSPGSSQKSSAESPINSKHSHHSSLKPLGEMAHSSYQAQPGRKENDSVARAAVRLNPRSDAYSSGSADRPVKGVTKALSALEITGAAKERPRSLDEKSAASSEDRRGARDSLRMILSNAYHKYKAEVLGSDEKKVQGEQKKPRFRWVKKASNLGPYANEKMMPKWLWNQLERGPRLIRTRVRGLDGRTLEELVPENETSGLVPMLAHLSSMDERVGFAYYCHPSVVHVCKTPREGGFCGYRNLQMIMSYIRNARAPGHQAIPPSTPGILLMQDWIEEAWDRLPDGAYNRAIVGRVKGTRKWIGSAEASSMLTHFGIACTVQGFGNESDKSKLAYEFLLDRVQHYFEEGVDMHYDELGQRSPPERVNRTCLPPIYLQEPGHSLTIVGLEIFSDGTRGLIVLDPMFITSEVMDHYLELGPQRVKRPNMDVMNVYRRGTKRLERHLGFEIVTLDGPRPQFPAWQVLERYGMDSHVYVFYDLSTQTWEVWRESEFDALFPWFWFGALYSIGRAAFASAPPFSAGKPARSVEHRAAAAAATTMTTGIVRNGAAAAEPGVLPGLCVPRCWRRYDFYSGVRRGLPYDFWLKKGAAAGMMGVDRLTAGCKMDDDVCSGADLAVQASWSLGSSSPDEMDGGGGSGGVSLAGLDLEALHPANLNLALLHESELDLLSAMLQLKAKALGLSLIDGMVVAFC